MGNTWSHVRANRGDELVLFDSRFFLLCLPEDQPPPDCSASAPAQCGYHSDLNASSVLLLQDEESDLVVTARSASERYFRRLQSRDAGDMARPGVIQALRSIPRVQSSHSVKRARERETSLMRFFQPDGKAALTESRRHSLEATLSCCDNLLAPSPFTRRRLAVNDSGTDVFATNPASLPLNIELWPTKAATIAAAPLEINIARILEPSSILDTTAMKCESEVSSFDPDLAQLHVHSVSLGEPVPIASSKTFQHPCNETLVFTRELTGSVKASTMMLRVKMKHAMATFISHFVTIPIQWSLFRAPTPADAEQVVFVGPTPAPVGEQIVLKWGTTDTMCSLRRNVCVIEIPRSGWPQVATPYVYSSQVYGSAPATIMIPFVQVSDEKMEYVEVRIRSNSSAFGFFVESNGSTFEMVAKHTAFANASAVVNLTSSGNESSMVVVIPREQRQLHLEHFTLAIRPAAVNFVGAVRFDVEVVTIRVFEPMEPIQQTSSELTTVHQVHIDWMSADSFTSIQPSPPDVAVYRSLPMMLQGTATISFSFRITSGKRISNETASLDTNSGCVCM